LGLERPGARAMLRAAELPGTLTVCSQKTVTIDSYGDGCTDPRMPSTHGAHFRVVLRSGFRLPLINDFVLAEDVVLGISWAEKPQPAQDCSVVGPALVFEEMFFSSSRKGGLLLVGVLRHDVNVYWRRFPQEAMHY
jgi:hypothetical protein